MTRRHSVWDKRLPGLFDAYSSGERQGLGLDELTEAEETWGLGAAGPQTSGAACLALIFTPPSFCHSL